MTTPSVVGTPVATSHVGAGTSRNIDLPTGISAAERILIGITTDNSSGVNFTPPTGFTKILEVAGSVCNGAVFEKVNASGSESGTVTCSITSSCNNSEAVAYRISGTHATAAGEAQGTTGTSTSPDPPFDTASWGADDNLAIAIFGKRAASAFSSYPSGYTANQISGSAGNVLTAMASKPTTSNSENPGAFGIGTSVGWWAGTVMIRPVGANSNERGVRGVERGMARGVRH